MAVLDQKERLDALYATALLDTVPERAFDRLTRLATRLLGTPAGALSLVDAKRQFFKSAVGLAEPWASRRETPISHSFCRHVVETGQPFVVGDAPLDPRLRGNPGVEALGVVAYLGVPLVTSQGHVLGALCVIDHKPRVWGDEDLELVREIADSVMTEIELRRSLAEAAERSAAAAQVLAELTRVRDALSRKSATLEAVFSAMTDAVAVVDLKGRLVSQSAAAAALFAPSERGDVAAPVARALGGERFDRVEIAAEVGPDGEARLYSVNSSPLLDPAGEASGAVLVGRDVTFERRAEVELRRSEERYRLLADNASDLVRVHALDGHAVYVSPSSERLLGYTPAELGAMAPEELLPDDDRARVGEHFARAVESGEGGSLLHRFRTNTGEPRWFETSLQPIHAPDGRVVQVQSASRDVTAWVSAEAAVREGEARIRRLADAAFEGLCVSADGVVLEANASFALLFGYSVQELGGMSAAAFIDDSDRPRASRRHPALADAAYESVGRRKDGCRFPIEVREQVAAWSGRTVCISAVRDLTPLASAEQARRLHSEILANMEEGVVLVRVSDGTIVYANPKFAEMFGYSLDELVDRHGTSLRPGDDAAVAEAHTRAIQTLLEADGRAHYEQRNVRKDGTILWCRATTSAMEHPEHGRVWVTVQSDITERKREAVALARQTALVDLLRATATEANAAGTIGEAMLACVRRIGERMDWPLGHAYLVTGESQGVELAPAGLWYDAIPERSRAFREATEATRFAPGAELVGRVLAQAKAQWTADVSDDPRFSRRAAASACGLRGGVALPVLVGAEVVAVLEFYSDRVELPDQALLAVLADVGAQLGRVVERERATAALERHAAEVKQLSLTDEMTGLKNRRGFLALASHALKIADRTGRGALLFFADLNGMKSINDAHGHDVGDEAIRTLAGLLQASFRETDIVARLGGDEFVVFAQDASPDMIATLGDRLRTRVEKRNQATRGVPFRLSVSMGAAIYDPGEPRSLEALMTSADAIMYEQKRARQRPTGPSDLPCPPSPSAPALRSGSRRPQGERREP